MDFKKILNEFDDFIDGKFGPYAPFEIMGPVTKDIAILNLNKTLYGFCRTSIYFCGVIYNDNKDKLDYMAKKNEIVESGVKSLRDYLYTISGKNQPSGASETNPFNTYKAMEESGEILRSLLEGINEGHRFPKEQNFSSIDIQSILDESNEFTRKYDEGEISYEDFKIYSAIGNYKMTERNIQQYENELNEFKIEVNEKILGVVGIDVYSKIFSGKGNPAGMLEFFQEDVNEYKVRLSHQNFSSIIGYMDITARFAEKRNDEGNFSVEKSKKLKSIQIMADTMNSVYENVQAERDGV